MRFDVQSIRDRKLFHWALAYLAGAWLVMQVVEVLSGRWPLPVAVQRAIDVALVAGFFVVLVLAWYHGERGRQRVSGPELLVLALLLGIGGGMVALVGRAPAVPGEAESHARAGSDRSIAPLRRVLVDNPAVAMLPLENWGSAADAHFVAGLHEDILSALQKLGGLTVISRTSVEPYRDTRKPLPVLARELGVDAVGEGSVSRQGSRIRVTVQLIDAATDAHLWSEQYDRELTAENVFAIRSEIARAVAHALKATLTPQEEAQLDATPTTSLTAYDWVQIARQRDTGSEERIRALRNALEADSLSALAWAELAVQQAASIQWQGAPESMADSAEAAADRALELDPLNPVAYRAKGIVAGRRGQNVLALRYTRRVLELDPGSVLGWNNLAVDHLELGQWVEALDAQLRRRRLQPTSAYVRATISTLYTMLGLYDHAVAAAEEGLAIDPRSAISVLALAFAHAYGGDLAAAAELAERAVTLDPDDLLTHQGAASIAAFRRDGDALLRHAHAAHSLAPDGLFVTDLYAVPTTLGFALLCAGDTAASRLHLETTERRMRDRLTAGAEDYGTRFQLAAIRSLRGDADQALRWLEEAYDAGFREAPAVELDPAFDDLRGHPDYERLMARIRADVAVMRDRVLEAEAELDRARLERGRASGPGG